MTWLPIALVVLGNVVYHLGQRATALPARGAGSLEADRLREGAKDRPGSSPAGLANRPRRDR